MSYGDGMEDEQDMGQEGMGQEGVGGAVGGLLEDVGQTAQGLTQEAGGLVGQAGQGLGQTTRQATSGLSGKRIRKSLQMLKTNLDKETKEIMNIEKRAETNFARIDRKFQELTHEISAIKDLARKTSKSSERQMSMMRQLMNRISRMSSTQGMQPNTRRRSSSSGRRKRSRRRKSR